MILYIYILYHIYCISYAYIYYYIPYNTYTVYILYTIYTYTTYTYIPLYYIIHTAIRCALSIIHTIYKYIHTLNIPCITLYIISSFLLYAVICNHYYSITTLSSQPKALHNLSNVSNVMFSVLLFNKLLIACLLKPVALHRSFCLMFLSIIICFIPFVISSMLLYLIFIINLLKE